VTDGDGGRRGPPECGRDFSRRDDACSYDVFEGWVHRHRLPRSCMWIGTASIAAKGGEHRRATGREAAPDAVWAGDGAMGVELILATARKPRGVGTDERGAARPAGQGNASGWDQRSGQRNRFLDGGYLRAFHRQFGRVAPAQWTCIGLWRDRSTKY